ncbi:MAG TPA: hypothetical protein DHU33_04090, partial [Firmicutes bacterium]|nr:hypothetical protein [Bacillota bacterium]
MKNKKLFILSIVGVLMLVSIVVATSYAYFVANVSGNKDTNNVVVTNGVMALEYKDGDEINLANAVPGNSVTKTFTVKNTGNVATNYTIYFSELSNKFVDKTDLVYTLTSSDGGKSIAQTQVPSKNDAMVSNYAIEAGKTHTYTLTITFLNKDENQNDNQGVSFSTKVTINETKEYVEPTRFEMLGKTIESYEVATDDPDNNIRYTGANPNNYVYFNCSDYSNQSDSTCEKWRIIGVFKNMTKEDGFKEDLVKIIRDDSLGNIAWDSNRVNDWSKASLKTTLNGDYYNGTYATGAFKNDSTRNAIESVVWNLGGSSTFMDVTASMFYERERGTTVYSGRPTTWTGKISLMYMSDYGYATSGNSTTDRATCLSKALYKWFSASDCYSDDYLYKSGSTQWTLVTAGSITGVVVRSTGFVDGSSYSVDNRSVAVRPAAYLKSSISLSSVGDGTSNSPYQLKVG